MTFTAFGNGIALFIEGVEYLGNFPIIRHAVNNLFWHLTLAGGIARLASLNRGAKHGNSYICAIFQPQINEGAASFAGRSRCVNYYVAPLSK